MSEGRRSVDVKEHTARNLRLAEQLGAETQTLVGRNVADVLIDFARSRNVDQDRRRQNGPAALEAMVRSTIVDQLLDKSGDIDVYIVSGEGEAPAPVATRRRPNMKSLERLCTGRGGRRHLRACSVGRPMRPDWLTPIS